jgi:hypothetical protein
MSQRWTPESRQRMAEAVRAWAPWKRSTGPRTDEGKRRSSRNAWKGGARPILRDLSRLLREQADCLVGAERGPSQRYCLPGVKPCARTVGGD